MWPARILLGTVSLAILVGAVWLILTKGTAICRMIAALFSRGTTLRLTMSRLKRKKPPPTPQLMPSGKQLQLDVVKLLLDGKDVLAVLEKMDARVDSVKAVDAEDKLAVWYKKATGTLQGTPFAELWDRSKVGEDYHRTARKADYIEVCRSGLDRLEYIKQLILDKEDSAIPNTPKLPQPPELHISYQKHKFDVLNGEPIIIVDAEYRPTGTMRIEAIELQLVGRSEPSLDWKVYEVKQDIWIASDNKFKVLDGISPGEHDVTLAAFANGEWWGSHPFTIIFPEVNS